MMAQPLSGFITLEEIIKGALRDMGESNTALYQRFMSWGMDGVNNLEYSSLRHFKRTFLGIDPSTMTAKLPDDFVQYTQVGLRTANMEFVPLVYNTSIIINPTIPTCDHLSDHCDCGCDDELCYALGESNVVTETTQVAIANVPIYITYCDYEYDLPITAFPYTIYIAINGTQTSGQLLSSQANLDTFFSNLAFTKNSSTNYSISQTSTVYGNIFVNSTRVEPDISGCQSVFSGYSDSLYNKTVTICTESDGTVIQRTCIPTVTNPQTTCDYDITMPVSDNDFPYTNVTFYKNNLTAIVGDLEDQDEMEDVFIANGFTVVSDVAPPPSFTASIEDTANQWTSITFTNDDGDTVTVEFTQSGCTTPTPTVETYCYEEKLCDVEVLECGCVVPTQTALNVLCNCCVYALAVTARRCKNKNFGQTFAQPNGFFGEFNIDIYERVIQVNSDYQYDSIYIEYYSANEVDSKNYLLPVQAKEAIIAWVYWKSIQKKRGVSLGEKMLAKKEFYNEKRILKQLMHPINLDEMFQAQRMLPRP